MTNFENFTPESRDEYLLAKIGGVYEGELPFEPDTRETFLLSKIAENGKSGGSGLTEEQIELLEILKSAVENYGIGYVAADNPFFNGTLNSGSVVYQGNARVSFSVGDTVLLEYAVQDEKRRGEFVAESGNGGAVITLFDCITITSGQSKEHTPTLTILYTAPDERWPESISACFSLCAVRLISSEWVSDK